MRIISGGQTGVDQGALEAALESQINLPQTWVGFCPSGRKAENGTIPSKYIMTEFGNYVDRTEQNVIVADATLVITYPGKLTPGTRMTLGFCNKHSRPFLHIHLGIVSEKMNVKSWMKDFDVVNVAGSRESKAPGIQQQTKDFLKEIFSDKCLRTL